MGVGGGVENETQFYLTAEEGLNWLGGGGWVGGWGGRDWNKEGGMKINENKACCFEMNGRSWWSSRQLSIGGSDLARDVRAGSLKSPSGRCLYERLCEIGS